MRHRTRKVFFSSSYSRVLYSQLFVVCMCVCIAHERWITVCGFVAGMRPMPSLFLYGYAMRDLMRREI